MPFEPTLPGNPHQLIINQHIFPRSAIQRFVASDGQVEVQHQSKVLRCSPKAKLFCAKRAWDQKAETSISHPIENAYAELANQIANGQLHSLTPAMDRTVSEFFLLWNYRFEAHVRPQVDVMLDLESTEAALTQEQEEILERKGAAFTRENKIPVRFDNGFMILRAIDQGMLRLANAHWGVVSAVEGEFLVPDTSGELHVVPVTPTVCLVLGEDDWAIAKEEVGRVNLALKTSSRAYFFARDLSRCPIGQAV